MPATTRRFSDPLGGILYLDTSVLMCKVELDTNGGSPAQAIAFLEKIREMARREEVALVCTDLVVNEMCFQIVRQKLAPEITLLQQEFKTNEKWWVALYRQHPEVLARCQPEIDRFYEFLQAYPLLVLSARDLEGALAAQAPHLAVRELMRQFYLLPTDAYHVVYSRLAGADAIATMDPDFSRVDGLTVYVPASLCC
jgi:predicted nucleic acid-binding protein